MNGGPEEDEERMRTAKPLPVALPITGATWVTLK
jgi:hypothetical protein